MRFDASLPGEFRRRLQRMLRAGDGVLPMAGKARVVGFGGFVLRRL